MVHLKRLNIASYKIALRITKGETLHPIVITIYDGQRKERHSVGWKVSETQWDKESMKVVKHPDKDTINDEISSKEGEIKQILADCRINRKRIPIGMIFKQSGAGQSFTKYMNQRANELYKDGKIAIAEKILLVSTQVERLFGNWYIADINNSAIEKLKSSLRAGKGRPAGQNTIRKKFKYLQRFYSELMDDGKAPGPNLFKKINLKIVPSKKTKHTKEQIALLERAELKANERLSVDMWLFAYYCQGIRFENCLTMRKVSVKNGRVHYQVNKGLTFISVKIHSKLNSIIQKYESADPVFIFPIGPGRSDIEAYLKEKNPSPDLKKKYKSAVNKRNTMVNEWLWKAGKKIGIDDISFHTARHTFAFHLKKVTMNIHAIKDALGHSTTQQTETYLKELDDETIDLEVEKLYGN